MNKTLSFRIIIDIILAISILNGWWLLGIIFGLIGAGYYGYFFEFILAGIAYDALFGLVPEMGWRGYAGTIVSVVLFLLLLGAKKIVRA
jgi:hypothetical protein